MERGLVPTEWKSAKSVPIHKTGFKSHTDNYRPIFIQVLERVVHRQLMSYLSEYKLLSEHQFVQKVF